MILTEAAAAKAKSLLDQEGRDDLALRIAVQPAAARACATTCSSMTAPSTAT
ncbi:iron-sulfur cluster assembly accessory family protein [Mycobacterium xenopi 3993]|nr:iron-sulfur cluster assembly accessory family protein [Mycobacterium xenopi 3993]